MGNIRFTNDHIPNIPPCMVRWNSDLRKAGKVLAAQTGREGCPAAPTPGRGRPHFRKLQTC